MFNPRVTDGYSAAQAKEFCPPGAKIFKDTKENRWRIKSDLLVKGPHSKSYGSGTGLSDKEAMKVLLMSIWRAYTIKTTADCLFLWDQL